VGFDPGHGRADLARAFIEAHAYGIRGNLEDLERAMGTEVSQVCLLGGAARSQAFTQLVADVVGRPIGQAKGPYPAGPAFAWLAARAGGADIEPPAFVGVTVEPGGRDLYEEGYMRYVAAGDAVRQTLAGWVA
jgi:sugar (pentulose or hexulose) kinase